MQLNEEQRHAVETEHPRVLCIAGAGAGKTRVLTERVARLILQGVPAEFILCVTFTTKAAEEMGLRIEARLEEERPGKYRRGPEIRTLHSWGARLLRQYPDHFGRTRDFSIYDERDQADVLRLVANDLGVDAKRIDTIRKKPEVVAEYERRLRDCNAFDFDQIERCALELLVENEEARREWQGRYRHVLVDEYQDTSLVQVSLLHKIEPPNFFIVGDPRQSIYRFRGAEPATIVEAARSADYEVIELTANYRSVPAVVELANRLVDGPWAPMASGREETNGHAVLGRRAPFEAPLVSQVLRWLHDDQGQPWASIAVLGRTWRGLDRIREHLEADGIPVNYCGDEVDPWNSQDGRQVARALLLAANPCDDNLAALLAEWGAMGERRFEEPPGRLRAQAMRVRSTLLEHLATLDRTWHQIAIDWFALDAEEGPTSNADRYIESIVVNLRVLETYGERGLESRIGDIVACRRQLDELFVDPAGFGEWWAARALDERLDRGSEDRVQIVTVHGGKGLEWENVILTECREGIYPTNRKAATDDDQAEDLRVLYVGVTRARDRLVVTAPALVPRYGRKGSDPAEVSPFLRDRTTLEMRDWRPIRWGGTLPEGW